MPGWDMVVLGWDMVGPDPVMKCQRARCKSEVFGDQNERCHMVLFKKKKKT